MEQMCTGTEFQVDTAATQKACEEKLLAMSVGLARNLYCGNARIRMKEW